MDIKTKRDYGYMVSELSFWEDNIDFLGIHDGNNNDSRFVVSLQKQPTEYKKISYDSRGFDNLYEVIDAVAGRTNVSQCIKNKIRFLYFDFDKVEFDECEFRKYIDDFLDALNAELLENKDTTEPIVFDDLQIHTKYRNEKVVSIHLIVTKYCMRYTQMKNLVKMINKNENPITLDEEIYDVTRRFCMCFNGKIGGELFEYHKSNSRPFQLIWIDDTTSFDTKMIDYTRELVEEVVEIEMDIVPYIVEKKDKYLRTFGKWNTFMLHVKYMCLMSREDFCENTLTTGYDYESNLREWDDADTRYALRNIDDVTKILFDRRFIRNPINNKFFDFIDAPTDLRNELSSLPKETKIIKTDKIEFEKKSGLLTYNGKTSLYYADIHRKPIISKTIDVSQKDIYDRVKNKKIVRVNALFGGGKTHFVISPFIVDAIDNGNSVLVITENNSLNKQYADDDRLNLISHLKKVNADYQVCSMESLYKLKKPKYDLVILDEFLSLMTHFHSDKTMRKNEIEIYEKMLSYVKKCEKCIICDADITADTYAGFQNEIVTDTEIYKIIVPKYDDYKYNIVFGEAKITSKIMEDLKNGLKVICACDMKQTAKSLQETILKKFTKSKNVLCVVGNETGEGYLFNGENLPTEQHTFLFSKHNQDADYDPTKKYDLCEFIDIFKVDVMIYSPKIKTGVSINGKAFDKQYGIGTGRSVTSREFIQMLHRARDLTDTNIWISVPKPKTDKNISLINADYVEKMYDDATNIFEEISVGKKIDRKTRNGLTEILAEGRAEIRRSQLCFTTEFYNSILNLGLKVEVHTEDMEEETMLETDSEVKKWLSLGLPTKQEIKEIVRKMKNDNDCLTANEIVTMKYLRYFLRYETTYSPKQNQIQKYCFYGLFEYDYLEAYLSRTDEKDIYALIEINRIRNNREKYLYDTTLSHEELLEIHNSYVDKTTKQQVLNDAKKNTALYFFKMLIALKDEKTGYIKKSLIKFSNRDLQILNAIYKHERKNKTELNAFNEKSKIEDVMRFISKLTMNNYGSKFIVSNTSRNSYREVLHNRLISHEKYMPKLEELLHDKGIDIKRIACRGAVKTDEVVDGFFKVRNFKKHTANGGRYSTKQDIYNNKIIKRKFNSSLYKTATANWVLFSRPHPKYPHDKSKTIYFYQKADNINQFYYHGIYEPNLVNVLELSKFVTDKTEDALIIYQNPYKKPKEPTQDNPIYIYQNVEEIVVNENYEDDKTHSEKVNRDCFYEEVTRPNVSYKNRGKILLRDLKYKIRIRDKTILPTYDRDDLIFDIENGFCFHFINASIPLIFHYFKITHSYKYIAKYEPDYEKPFTLNKVIDGHYIQKIYINHLETSTSHNLVNVKDFKYLIVE